VSQTDRRLVSQTWQADRTQS